MIFEQRVPVVAAPMAGGASTPELAASVSGAGALGFVAGGYRPADEMAEQIDRVRSLTGEPFGVNLFVPGRRRDVALDEYRQRVAQAASRFGVEPGPAEWDDDGYSAKLGRLFADPVPVVSFTFGLPEAATVEQLHVVGTEVVVTVTTPEEARLAAEVGADAVCVQGAEAGGHRATLHDDPDQHAGGPLLGLLPALHAVRAAVDVPVIAAGGIAHGADVAAVLSAGAVAAQLGTAFLVCDEAGTQPAHRAEIAAGQRRTEITRAFSGRPARGLVNRFLADNRDAPAAYPQVNAMTKPLRGAAGKAGDVEAMSLWAGQSYAHVRPMPAADLVDTLRNEAREALRSATERV